MFDDPELLKSMQATSLLLWFLFLMCFGERALQKRSLSDSLKVTVIGFGKWLGMGAFFLLYLKYAPTQPIVAVSALLLFFLVLALRRMRKVKAKIATTGLSASRPAYRGPTRATLGTPRHTKALDTALVLGGMGVLGVSVFRLFVVDLISIWVGLGATALIMAGVYGARYLVYLSERRKNPNTAETIYYNPVDGIFDVGKPFCR